MTYIPGLGGSVLPIIVPGNTLTGPVASTGFATLDSGTGAIGYLKNPDLVTSLRNALFPPGNVTSLVSPVNSATTTTVTLTWSAPATGGAATSYKVQTATSSSGPFTDATSSLSFASLTYTAVVTGLTAGTAYFFQVVATGAAGTSVTPLGVAVSTKAPQTITLAQPTSSAVTGTGFTVPVTFSPAYGTPPTLTLSINGGAYAALPTGSTVTTSGAQIAVPSQSAGTTTLRVKDAAGVLSALLSVTVAAPSSAVTLNFNGAAGSAPTGNAAVTGGALQCDGSGNVALVGGSSSISTFTALGDIPDGKIVTINLASNSPGHDFLLYFRQQADGTGYALSFQGSTGKCDILKTTPSGVELQQISIPTTFNSVGYIADDNNIVLLVNGSAAASITDGSYLTPGKIGVLNFVGGSPTVLVNSITIVDEPVYTESFGPGIYYPDNIAISNTANAYIPICSGFARFASNLPQTWSLSGPDAGAFILSGVNGSTLYAPTTGGAYSNTTKTSFSVTVNVTDGITTYSAPRTITNGAAYIYAGSNVLLDTEPNKMGYFTSYGHMEFGRSPDAVTITDPSGLFATDPYVGNTTHTAAAVPVFHHYGTYPVTLVNGNLTQAVTYWIAAEQPAYTRFDPAGTIYSYLSPGDLVGTLVAYSDAGIFSIVLTASDGTLFATPSGRVGVAQGATLTPGTKSFTALITSLSGKTTSVTVPYTVVAGTAMAASAMTLAASSTLDNWVFGQTIGTPTVSGMTGTPTWTITSVDDGPGIFNGGALLNLFSINPSTGAITAPNQLPATGTGTKRPSGIPITVTVVSGGQRCRQTFNIPVAWKAGPTFYVGQGMAAAHGANGFDDPSQIMQMFQNSNDPHLPAGIAGATVYWDANTDPNFFSAYNCFRNNDANLRFPLRGPAKFIAADLSSKGIRTRVGGTVGQGGGGDPGFKAFFLVGSGDFVIDGFEVSWVNGPDYGQGLSAIRKDADNWGDFTVSNCDIHDSNNGIEPGNGSYIFWGHHNRITNWGTEYVGSGATHGIYVGACTDSFINDNLIYKGTNGHGVKSRAKASTITNNRIFDGEDGNMSSCIEVCEAGKYTISSNVLHKGPNSQNPFVVQYADERYLDANGNLYRTNVCNITGNTFSLMSIQGTHFGSGIAVGAGGQTSNIDGSSTVVTLTGNSYFLATNDETLYSVEVYNGFGVEPLKTETGAVTLTAPPTLDFTSPLTGAAVVRPGPYFYVEDGAQTYDGFNGVQIDFGNENIVVSHIAAQGTILAGPLKAEGSILNNYHPFVAGTTWSIITTPEYYATPTWAPAGRYTVTSNANGTGSLNVGSVALSAAGSVDYIKVMAVAPNGATAIRRAYITVT